MKRRSSKESNARELEIAKSTEPVEEPTDPVEAGQAESSKTERATEPVGTSTYLVDSTLYDGWLGGVSTEPARRGCHEGKKPPTRWTLPPSRREENYDEGKKPPTRWTLPPSRCEVTSRWSPRHEEATEPVDLMRGIF